MSVRIKMPNLDDIFEKWEQKAARKSLWCLVWGWKQNRTVQRVCWEQKYV
ncbi:MAG: hypothetical protein ACFFFB_07965 [Candidatus Heimdallarchaeota archaeon]